MDGAGPVSAVASQLEGARGSHGDPGTPMGGREDAIRAIRRNPGRFEELDGYARRGSAREVSRLSFSPDMIGPLRRTWARW